MSPSRIALVTGAANGIGLAGSQALLRAGHRVVMIDEVAFDPRALIAPEWLAQVQAARFDVTDTAAARELDKLLMKTWGPVSILVINAGISPKLPGRKSAGLLEIGSAEWDRVLDVNLSGAMRPCQLFVPRMKASSWGRIVNVSSLAGRARSAFAGASYSASKAGLIGLTRAIASELARLGSRLTAWPRGASRRAWPSRRVKSRTGATPSRYPCAVWARRPKWPRPSFTWFLKMPPSSTARCWI